MPLRACAHTILRNTEMVTLNPLVHEPHLLVDRAYVLAYERGQAGKQRAIFQRAQLPWLGVDVRLVTGYDAQQLQPWHRECLFADSHPANNATHPQQPMYVSQVLKMWAAFYDMWASAIRLGLIMEDDAVVHFGRLPALNIVLRTLAACPHANKTILHLSTYSPIGHSTYSPYSPCGLSRASPAPRLWSGVANIVTKDVARHFLDAVQAIPPDASASDKVLSVLLTTYYLLLTTYSVLRTAYYVLLTTYYLLLTTYYLLPTTYYLLRQGALRTRLGLPRAHDDRRVRGQAVPVHGR
jgi:hypothetical protein